MILDLGRESRVKVNALYISALFLVSLAIVACCWLTMHFVFVTLQPLARATAENVGSNSSLYNQVDAFFINVDYWLAILALIALMIGAWAYSQRKGVPAYGY